LGVLSVLLELWEEEVGVGRRSLEGEGEDGDKIDDRDKGDDGKMY
jgi:hypothetical protein